MLLRLIVLLGSISLVAACSSDNNGSTPAGDTGQTTGGDAGEPEDATAPAGDTGVHPDAIVLDATPIPTCDNPYDGTGCANAQNQCVWVSHNDNDQLQCRIVPNPKGLEQVCSTVALDCGPGLTCIQLMGEPGNEPTCHQVCSTTSGTPGTGICANVMGMAATYSCTRLTDKTYGVCVGGGQRCTPYMDMCPANETCTLQGSATTCEPSGNTARGGNCMSANCVKGSICVGFVGDPNPVCYEPCNPQNPMCSGMNDTCLGVGGQTFGVCQTPMINCDPLNDMCPGGEACSYDAPDVVCRPAGNTARGGNCSAEACQRGSVCVQLTTDPNPVCYEPCDLMNPACSMGNCGNIGLPFGICVP